MDDRSVLDKLRASMKTGLDYYIHEYMKDIEWYDIYNDFTDPKFMKYSETHDMMEHCDHVRYVFDGKRKGIPILTVLGLLNDNFDGGDFVLIDEKINFSKGDILVFPSNFMYPHKVEPVTKGTRYSYISWIW